MDILEFLSQYLASPIVAHRNRATLCLFQEALTNSQAVSQLGLNLRSKNFDIVFGSLRILLAISLRAPEKVKPLIKGIISLGKQTGHFGIANLSKDILANLINVNLSLQHPIDLISTRVTPAMKYANNSNDIFYTNCDHFIEYELGGKNNMYEFSHICEVFKYDCKKAFRQVTYYMKIIGYKKGVQYWEESPSSLRYDIEGKHYKTRLHYYARHAIQMFLMWCVKNLSVSIETWKNFLVNERKWDASIPDLLVEEKPEFIKFTDLQVDAGAWLKKRIKKADAYELLNSKAEWIPLYERTYFKTEDKSFEKRVTTCFVRTPTEKLSKKIKVIPVDYSCRSCYINELPLKAKKKELLNTNKYSHSDFLEDRLIPSYGTVSEDFGGYVKLFPAPEIVEYFKLTQKKNSLEYYKGKQLVIHCINWESGYHRNIDGYGEDKFELANYGYLLIISSKYLKRYLLKNNLKLIAVGEIWKRKVGNLGREYPYNSKNAKYKQLSFEIVKI
ncbi:MAG: hypothetical protein WC614_10900 [bacterium]